MMRWMQFVAMAMIAIGLTHKMAWAQDVVPQSPAQIKLSFAPVVRSAAPAVVNIYTKRVVQERVSPFSDDPFFQQFFGGDSGFGVPRERVQRSLGSGVIIDPKGLIVTNHHVIEGADEVVVLLHDRREFAAQVIADDARTDLAILKIQAPDASLPTLTLGKADDLQVGDLVLAIGNPFGVGQTVTSGIVSALARTRTGISDYGFFIQTDAAINPGNSGGALVSMDGKLVGINTAIFSRKGGGSVGIGFAIPSDMVATIITAAGQGGKIIRPWLGASGQNITADLLPSLKLDRLAGVLVNEIYPDSPAAQAGLAVGDVILSINGRQLEDAEALRFRLATLPVGSQAKLQISRNGNPMELSINLSAPPEIPARQQTLLRQGPLAGVEIANLSPAVAEELSLDATSKGVVIIDVARGSPAQRLGIRPGDLLLQLNDQVTKVSDAVSAAAADTSRWKIQIKRDGKVQTLVLR